MNIQNPYTKGQGSLTANGRPWFTGKPPAHFHSWETLGDIPVNLIGFLKVIRNKNYKKSKQKNHIKRDKWLLICLDDKNSYKKTQLGTGAGEMARSGKCLPQAREPELDAHHWRENLRFGLGLGLGLVRDVAPQSSACITWIIHWRKRGEKEDLWSSLVNWPSLIYPVSKSRWVSPEK